MRLYPRTFFVTAAIALAFVACGTKDNHRTPSPLSGTNFEAVTTASSDVDCKAQGADHQWLRNQCVKIRAPYLEPAGPAILKVGDASGTFTHEFSSKGHRAGAQLLDAMARCYTKEFFDAAVANAGANEVVVWSTVTAAAKSREESGGSARTPSTYVVLCQVQKRIR